MGKIAIVVSGKPASGKTTIGSAVANVLKFPFLDKDEFLESLFNEKGIGGQDWRTKLSSLSNENFQQAAEKTDKAVLVSHWRPADGAGQSGTPTGWLSETFETIIELHCRCSADLAAQRFMGRKRHPGNLDEGRSLDELITWMKAFETGYPLGLGYLVEADATMEIDLAEVTRQLRDFI